MHECFHKHSRVGTARMKEDNETDEDGKKRGVIMEESTVGYGRKYSRARKKEVPTAYHYQFKIQY